MTWDRLDPSRIGGMDLSHYNGVVDLAKGRDAGLRFVFIKAANGINETAFWRANWDGAKRAGLPRGAYVWLYPHDKITGTAQANKWWDLLKDDPGELPLVIDFEKTTWDGEPANPDSSDLYGVVERWIALSGKKPIIYTGYYYWLEYGSPTNYWAQYDLWVARYKATEPLIPPPFAKEIFWQWTETGDGVYYGHDPLVSHAADLNYFNGTEAEWQNYLGGYIPPATGEPMKYIFVCANPGSDRLNIRTDHVSGSSDIGDLMDGETAKGEILWEGNGEKWLLVREVRGTPFAVQPAWVCVYFGGVSRGSLTVEDSPPAAHNIKVYLDGVMITDHNF